MSNYYAPCFYRIDLVVIPSYIELPCFTFYAAAPGVFFVNLTSALFFRWHLVMFCVIITDISLMGHFEFLHDPRMICFPSNISQKLQAETIITFISVNTKQHLLILKINIDHSSKREPPLFFHSDTSPVLGNGLVHFVDKTHLLAVTAELIWLFFLDILSFKFFQKPSKSLRFRRFRRSYVNRPVDDSTNHCHSFTAFFPAVCPQ